MDPVESDIIKECRAGEPERFGELYEKYIKKIYTFVYYKTHHKETAEDLTSTVFFKALANIGQCDPEKPFSAWLYRIAQNTVIDHYRTRKSHVAIEDAWDIRDTTDLDGNIDTHRSIEEVKKYLSVLAPIQRDIVILRVWEDLSYRDIAEIVGKNEDNCKTTYSRAIQKLREHVPLSLFLFLFIKSYLYG